MKRFLLSAVLFLAGATAFAGGWYYQNLNAPENFFGQINGMYLEPRGYAWGATSNGLFRYGTNSEFNWYRAGGTEGSLPSNNVLRVMQGSSNGIWVATDGGMFIYNPASDSFRPICLDGPDDEILHGYCYFQDRSGTEYIGGEDALYKYDPSSGKASKVVDLGVGEGYIVEDIYPTDRGTLLLFNSTYCVTEYSPENGSIWHSKAPDSPVFAHLMDSRGTLWTSHYNRGVECFSSDGQVLYSLTKENSELSSNLVSCFLERNGQLFIGTEGGGINVFDPNTGKFSLLDRDENIFNSFPCSSVSFLSLDASNSIWAITPSLDAVIIREGFMRNYAIAPINSQTGHSSDNVVSLAESVYGNHGYLLVGTFNSGLYRMDMDQERFGSNVVFEQIGGTSGKHVESLAALQDGRVLVSLKAEGLYLLNPASGELSPFGAIRDNDFLDQLKYSNIPINLSVDDSGKVIILMDKAYVWDPRTNSVSVHEIQSLESRGSLYPVVGGDGRFYYSDRYLFTWDSVGMSHYVLYDMGPDVSVTSVTKDRSGMFWIATDNGIYNLDSTVGQLTRLDLGSLSSAKIIAADYNNRIWLGTTSGMYLYLPQLGNVTPFTANDGVDWNNYNGMAWCISGHNLYFGGQNGLLSVDSEMTFQLADKPELSLESILLDGERRYVEGRKLKVSAYSKSFIISVLAKENNFMRSKMFRYTVKSPVETREIVQPESRLQFNTLESGNYSIDVSCTMQNGEYTDPVHLLDFKVNPVWYRSLTFWLCVLGAILIAGIFVFYSFRRNSKFQSALAESEAQAKAGQESVRFLLNVSHELKTPLTLIISPLARILKNKDKSDPEYSSLKNIYRQANRMSSLILTVLNAHKIQEGVATLNATDQDLNVWVESITESFDDEAEGRRMRIERSYDNRLAPIAIDGQKLENVMTNMLINAFKHSPDDSVITVGTEAHPADGMVRVYVSDQGEGLGGVDMTKLFSRYYQGYTQQTGSGLGLAYANSIVELHKGTMGAFENKDCGSTFYFDIPGRVAGTLSSEDLQRQGVEERLKKSAAIDVSEASILFVDDDPDLREYVAGDLEEYCKEIFTVANGEEALAFLRQQRVDVVISDVMMPVMDGFELCSAIKTDELLQDIIVVLLTAKVGPRDKEKGLSLGADDYIPKPFDEKDLVASINKLLKK